MARTAVITGTATAVSGAVQNRQRAAAQQQQAAYQQEAVTPPPPAPPSPSPTAVAAPPPTPTGTDLMGQLAQLGQMKEAGLIDDAAFTAAKAQLLGL